MNYSERAFQRTVVLLEKRRNAVPVNAEMSRFVNTRQVMDSAFTRNHTAALFLLLLEMTQVDESQLCYSCHKAKSLCEVSIELINILNTSIEQGCHPNTWKRGQVTPLFKEDDESNKANYKPVTALPVLNNIYERPLAAQLGKFHSTILSDVISSQRKFYSCETALLRLTEDWRRMRDKGNWLRLTLQTFLKLLMSFSMTYSWQNSKHMELAKEVARYFRTTCQEDSSE